MSADLIIFYIYMLGLLAAFALSFMIVITFMALRAKLNGGDFFETLRDCWNNC